MKKEFYISVDVETAGPIPGEYSMLSLGACLVGNTSRKFYSTFKPITKNFVPEALAISGFSLDELEQTGAPPKMAMDAFNDWISEITEDGRPVFVAFNATFDWQFVNYYFCTFLGRNPFGISGLDIKAYYMGKFGTTWSDTSKKRFDKRFLSKKPHTHNALDDAIEQAEIFEKLLRAL